MLTWVWGHEQFLNCLCSNSINLESLGRKTTKQKANRNTHRHRSNLRGVVTHSYKPVMMCVFSFVFDTEAGAKFCPRHE